MRVFLIVLDSVGAGALPPMPPLTATRARIRLRM